MRRVSGTCITAPCGSGMNTDFDPRTLFPDLSSQLPLGGLPNVNINNHVAIGDYGGSERGKQFTRQIVDNLTFIRGKHTFKTGINISNFRVSSPPAAFGLLSGAAQNASFGRFDFTGRFTSGGTSAGAEHAFADFLLGYPEHHLPVESVGCQPVLQHDLCRLRPG